MSFSARPLAEASTAFERQLAARADRLPERRASHTATPAMTAIPSRIHSHRSEEPDSLAAGAGEASAGAAEGLGDCVAGGCAGGEDGSVVDVGVPAEAVSDGGAAG